MLPKRYEDNENYLAFYTVALKNGVTSKTAVGCLFQYDPIKVTAFKLLGCLVIGWNLEGLMLGRKLTVKTKSR